MMDALPVPTPARIWNPIIPADEVEGFRVYSRPEPTARNPGPMTRKGQLREKRS
jgi:hypothetical protein